MALAPARADGDVALTVCVDDEDGGALHTAPQAQPHPRVRGGCLHLEVHVTLPGRRRRLRHRHPEAHAVRRAPLHGIRGGQRRGSSRPISITGHATGSGDCEGTYPMLRRLLGPSRETSLLLIFEARQRHRQDADSEASFIYIHIYTSPPPIDEVRAKRLCIYGQVQGIACMMCKARAVKCQESLVSTVRHTLPPFASNWQELIAPIKRQRL